MHSECASDTARACGEGDHRPCRNFGCANRRRRRRGRSGRTDPGVCRAVRAIKKCIPNANSLLPQHEIDHPAASNVRARRIAVVEDVGVIAPGTLKRVREGGQRDDVSRFVRAVCLGHCVIGPPFGRERGGRVQYGLHNPVGSRVRSFRSQGARWNRRKHSQARSGACGRWPGYEWPSTYRSDWWTRAIAYRSSIGPP